MGTPGNPSEAGADKSGCSAWSKHLVPIMKPSRIPFLLVLLGLWLSSSAPFSRSGLPSLRTLPANGEERLQDILHYISTGWGSLTRSMTQCGTVTDPKAPEKSVLYLPDGFPAPAAVQDLRKSCSIRIEHLSVVIHRLGQIDASSIHPPGLLYLENPYVVPGGRFNEMYGWDSYFIIRGLVRDGRLDLARGMVENFFFELDHYGGVLNANRTYYLTRSQPPFLTSMILAVFDAEKSGGQDDQTRQMWLAKAYPYAVKDYDLWTHAPHLAGDTGLSRYYDFGDGPVPEMADSPGYYRRAAGYFVMHPGVAGPYLSQTKKAPPSLTPEFYKGDRSMRESGFDTSFRFGPYSAGTHHYAPVCLNSLLYKAETDLEQISARLGKQRESEDWRQRALHRREQMNRYLWNAKRGLFFDYNFDTRTQSTYEYATTFYPLWVGLASPEQARAVERNLKIFEQPGGLAMSLQNTGAQWDYPYGWAPIQLIAVEGLRRYGYDEDANRVSYDFLSTVLQNFRRDGTIREKYNVVTRSSETKVEAGYQQNVIGFGWTNGVFLEHLHSLPQDWRTRLGAE